MQLRAGIPPRSELRASYPSRVLGPAGYDHYLRPGTETMFKHLERNNSSASVTVDCGDDPIAALKSMFVDLIMRSRVARGQDPVFRPVFLKPHGVARNLRRPPGPAREPSGRTLPWRELCRLGSLLQRYPAVTPRFPIDGRHRHQTVWRTRAEDPGTG